MPTEGPQPPAKQHQTDYYRRQQFLPHQEKTHEVPDDLVPSEPCKVLMLEDDEDLSSILAKALEGLPCTVTRVTNGVDGLRQVMATDFDAIVCDMVMPNLPGDMFYLAVERARPHLCKRFIFMTGHKSEKRWDEFARSKGCLILWKPFELHIFLDAVQMVMDKARARGK
jgi:DNA-binding NtrC family response regulator